MPYSSASTATQYLDELPPDRRAVVSAVRDMILRSLPEGYSETMGCGMISYGIPLEHYPDTYNGQPLCYVSLAAQRNHYALYLMGCYAGGEQSAKLRAAFERSGKKLDMGQACVRFRRLDDIPLEDIAELIADVPVDAYIAIYEASRPSRRRTSGRQAGAPPTAP